MMTILCLIVLARLNFSLMSQSCVTLSNISNGKISMFVLYTFLIHSLSVM
uniref:Uncharacterized protein n=1 Tax=Arundo donax TaxID=35708 RepID=A0A0A9ET11_ARUDO